MSLGIKLAFQQANTHVLMYVNPPKWAGNEAVRFRIPGTFPVQIALAKEPGIGPIPQIEQP